MIGGNINWVQVSRNRRRGWGKPRQPATSEQIQRVRSILEELAKRGHLNLEDIAREAAVFDLKHEPVPGDDRAPQSTETPAGS